MERTVPVASTYQWAGDVSFARRKSSTNTTTTRRCLAVALAVLCSLALAAVPAAAADPDAIVDGVLSAPDPAAAYDALSAQDRAVFDDHMLPAAVKVDTTAVTPADDTARASAAAGAIAFADGCWAGRADGSAQSTAGNTLYTFFVTGSWCVTGGAVTSSSLYQAGGETATPGWRFEGTTSSGADVIGGQGRSFASQRFVLGSYGIDIQTVDECMRVNGQADSYFTSTRTCSLV